MSEAGKKDGIGLVVKIAGAVTAVAAAAAAVVALIPENRPPPSIRGDISEISTEPGVTLAEYQQRAPKQPKRCAGFRSPSAGAKDIAMAAPRRAGGRLALATVGSGAVRIAQSRVGARDAVAVDARATQDTTTTTDTTTTNTTTTDTTTTTGTTTTGTTTTGTTTTGTTTGTTTTGTTPTPGLLFEKPTATAALTLAGDDTLRSSQTARLLSSTRSKDRDATAQAIRRINGGASAGNAALKGEIADAAADLVGEVVSFRVRIIGLAGRCTYVRWSLYDAETRRRAKESQFANRAALYFRPEAVDDFASSEVWVGLPRRKGPFFVLLELFKNEGSGLARGRSPRFG